RLAEEVKRFVENLREGETWEGRVGELYEKLNAQVGEEQKALARERKWPKDSNKLRGALNRIIPSLPYWGINVTFGEHTRRGRPVYLQKLPPKVRKGSSPRSPPSPPNEINDLEVTVLGGGSSPGSPGDCRAEHPGERGDRLVMVLRSANPLKLREGDGGDRGDDPLQKLGGVPRGHTPGGVSGNGRGTRCETCGELARAGDPIIRLDSRILHVSCADGAMLRRLCGKCGLADGEVRRL